jgi:hypothetical protein
LCDVLKGTALAACAAAAENVCVPLPLRLGLFRQRWRYRAFAQAAQRVLARSGAAAALAAPPLLGVLTL